MVKTQKMVPVKQTCIKCGDKKLFIMSENQYNNLVLGRKHIQDIFPDMLPDDRERFISGICGICFDKMFGDE